MFGYEKNTKKLQKTVDLRGWSWYIITCPLAGSREQQLSKKHFKKVLTTEGHLGKLIKLLTQEAFELRVKKFQKNFYKIVDNENVIW